MTVFTKEAKSDLITFSDPSVNILKNTSDAVKCKAKIFDRTNHNKAKCEQGLLCVKKSLK